MHKWVFLILSGVLMFFPAMSKSAENEVFPLLTTQSSVKREFGFKTNLLPWLITVPNIGMEVALASKCSAVVDIWYCPWKISDRFSVKTVAILPELRWWIKSNKKGSYLNIHFNVAWFNVRANNYRYQDNGRPLLGAGIGYGFRLPVSKNWCLDFEIGAGMANARYDRFYNINNGALKDTQVSTYWGIDRAAVAFTYFIM